MINTAEVMLWGTRIGIIHMNEANGNVEFPIVKDTTPNITNPRLYDTA